MPLSSEHRIRSGFVEELLTLPTLDQRAEFLRAAGLLNADGLDRLLDVADRSVYNDPGKAHRLAALCEDVADRAAAPAAVPRAAYVRLAAYDENGEFDAALRMARIAYDGYVALGKNLEALRTHVGRMSVLLDLGLYREALDAGQIVLDALDGTGELVVRPTRQQTNLLTALVHQNRGLCYEYMGRYEEALDAYRVAEECYKALDMTERLGEISSNRGAILSYLGRGNEALEAHEAAAATFDRAGLTLARAKALGNVGETHLQLADYTRSLDAFEKARRLLAPLDALSEEGFLLRNTATAYLQLNLYSEALATYEEAEDLLRTAGMTHARAWTLWGMGSALIACSELGEAEEALAKAEELFARADNMPLLSGVMLERAALLEARGDRQAALDTTRQALALVARSEWAVQHFYAHLRLADLLLPDAAAAEPHLLAAGQLSEHLALPHLRYRLHERLGRLRRLQGRGEEARVLLEAAVEEIERLRGTVAHEAVRASFLRDKTAAYEELLQLYLGRDDEEGPQLAFAVAEKAKSRTLADVLAGLVERMPGASADPELEERIRKLQADLNATYSRMVGVADDAQGAPLANLHKRAIELEKEIGRLRLRTAPLDPFADTVPLEDVLEQLPTDVTLLSYHVVGDEILAFVHARNGIRVVRDVGSAAMAARLLRRLNIQWDRFRAGREFVERHMTLLERSTRQVLASLYGELFAPLAGLLDEAVDPASDGNEAPRKLVIVPHGLLHQVPFHALFDGERYLLERFEVSYAPSAKVYSLCQNQPLRESSKSLMVSVADSLIPAVSGEAHAVAQHVPGAEVMSDRQATVDALRSAASGCGVLHLACHGLFRADNPMFSSLKLHDGWLTAADAMRLDLEGALVTLSACESGRNEVFAGDELIGLTRAFLGAGAATLAVSLWLVQDETTASLMARYYERLRDGAGPAEALRAAQLAIKDEHPHPYYWAPFVLIGRR